MYLLVCELISGTNKGSRFILGDPDHKMTHKQVIRFRDAHTKRNDRLYHIVET